MDGWVGATGWKKLDGGPGSWLNIPHGWRGEG